MHLKKQLNIISLLIAAIFFITVLPFNALHHHEADEHYAALASHNKAHTCPLDRNFCNGLKEFSCGHEKHINNPLTKCFTCLFHFEKNYDAITVYSCCVFSFQNKEHFDYITYAATSAAKLISNKGPPVLM